MRPAVIGIDGGGTHTRVAITDVKGNVLSYVEKGASSIFKDLKAKDNVQQAIIEAIKKSGCNTEDIIYLAAGIAGYDREEDLSWVKELTEVAGLKCPRLHVNDAVIAHSGAFMNEAGIIAISGTGSIVFGINEKGKQIRNYDFHHYAASTARHLAYNVVYKIIAGERDYTDNELVNYILQCFKLESVNDLAAFAANGFEQDRRERDKFFGSMAPIITDAASKGSNLASFVCNSAVEALTTGIRIVGTCFASDIINVAFVGSVINSSYIKQNLKESLLKESHRKYHVVEEILPAVFGGVLLSMKNAGIAIDKEVINNMGKYII